MCCTICTRTSLNKYFFQVTDTSGQDDQQPNPVYDRHDILTKVLDHCAPFSPLWSHAAYNDISEKRLSNAIVETTNREVKRTVHFGSKLPTYIGQHVALMFNAFNDADRTFLDDNYMNAVHKPRTTRAISATTPKSRRAVASKASSDSFTPTNASPNPDRVFEPSTQEEGYNKRGPQVSPTPLRNKFSMNNIKKLQERLATLPECSNDQFESNDEKVLPEVDNSEIPLMKEIRQVKMTDTGFVQELNYFNPNDYVATYSSGLQLEERLDHLSYLSLDEGCRFLESTVNFLIGLLISINDALTNVVFLNTYKANTLYKLSDVRAKCQSLTEDDKTHLKDNKSIVFVPILYEFGTKKAQNHFVLTVVDNKQKKMFYLDPLKDKKTLFVGKSYQLANEHLQNLKATTGLDAHQLVFLPHKLQRDSVNCGPIVVAFADNILSTVDPASNNIDINAAFPEKPTINYGSKSVTKRLRLDFQQLIQNLDVKDYCTECNGLVVDKKEHLICFSCKHKIHPNCFETPFSRCITFKKMQICHKCLRFNLNLMKK